MRILLVEDDKPIAEVLSRRLSEAGHAVDTFATSAEAEAAWLTITYDLAIVDVMLEDGDGRDLVRNVRRRHIMTPILMLTARDEIGDRVQGLDAGADDYLLKPFAFDELMARMRALVRRPANVASATRTLGNVTLAADEGRVCVDGTVIGLSAQEISTLERLMRSSGRVIPKRALGEHLYTFDHEWTDNAVETIVHRLRKKLATSNASLEIKTLRGIGYLLMEVEA
ncbi:MAG: response regulator [Hyphomonadaceae bacterium]